MHTRFRSTPERQMKVTLQLKFDVVEETYRNCVTNCRNEQIKKHLELGGGDGRTGLKDLVISAFH